MARHAQRVPRSARYTSRGSIALIWLAGLLAGCYALLSVGARYGCGSSQHGLGCRNAGSAIGVALVVGVIATVTAVTTLLHQRAPAHALLITVAGLVALAGCAVGAHALLGTI